MSTAHPRPVRGPFGGALGGSPTAAVGAVTPVGPLADVTARGRTQVTSRAITRVVSALAADSLGVEVRSVSVRLSDDEGKLAVTVSSPIRVEPLAVATGRAPQTATGTAAGADGTILDRAQHAQQHILENASALTGSGISKVTVHLTGIETVAKERVR